MGGFRTRVRRERGVLFAGNEPRDVLPRVDHNVQGVPRSLALVILFQLLAQAVQFHPHDGVTVLVEIRCPAEGFGGQSVFLDLVGPAPEVLFANVLKQFCLARGFGKDARTEDTLQFVPFLAI